MVRPFGEHNVVCGKIICLNTATENWKKLNKERIKLVDEYNKFVSKSKFCDNCLKYSHNSHRCSKCLSAQYCSKKCLEQDWVKFHEKVCDKWATDEKRKMPAGGEQVKSIKKEVRAINNKKCIRPDCQNR